MAMGCRLLIFNKEAVTIVGIAPCMTEIIVFTVFIIIIQVIVNALKMQIVHKLLRLHSPTQLLAALLDLSVFYSVSIVVFNVRTKINTLEAGY